MSSLVDSEVSPSMVILLSSHSTLRRPSFSVAARPIASWLMPSIRQPSPAITRSVVDQVIAERGVEMALGHRHAHGHGQALPQRACGAFHAFQQEAGCRRRAGHLPEAASIVGASYPVRCSSA
jgi:hypothetical protein